MSFLTALNPMNLLKKKEEPEAALTLGGPSGKSGVSKVPKGPVKKFSSVGYSLVGGGALDCVEGIGQCPLPACLMGGRKWGPCLPLGCDKAKPINFPSCRVTDGTGAEKCTTCSA